MNILDCENYTSAVESLANIYKISTDEIEAFFSSFDLDKHYETNDVTGYADKEIQNVFENTFKIKPQKLDKVCWFHLTRALPTENFYEGILPLTESLEKVWQTFFDVFNGTPHYNNLKQMKLLGVDDRIYNLKAGVELHSGPYAMLVRDSAFNSSKIGNHDYLGMPEILEDICNGYKKQFGSAIYEFLESKLLPKIIKFVSTKDLCSSNIGTAMFYTYGRYHNKSISFSANTCFDGENSLIPFTDILNIETIIV